MESTGGVVVMTSPFDPKAVDSNSRAIFRFKSVKNGGNPLINFKMCQVDVRSVFVALQSTHHTGLKVLVTSLEVVVVRNIFNILLTS